nr:alanine--tRNA ligase [Anaerolineae bacterium]
MEKWDSSSVRQAFLDFFAGKGHAVVQSSSLVPGKDPTLLFTNAGMVQFKDVFLGTDSRSYARATTAQKCMRISGKHNDLENVGPSPRHHTFFEMLGNFSFGDYFKREAIHYAYELITEVYQIPPNRLVFTVFQTDDEAYDIWTKEIGISPARVARMSPKTNFWQMAETGPCGPTSEIHWDLKPELGEASILEALQKEDDRFLELWNLVFMEYNRTEPDPDHSGQYDIPLPAPGVDTGMGFERLLAVMQGVKTNYDTELFTDLMDATQEILGHDDATREQHNIPYRVIADHIRAASFLIADGVNPGTTGREYIPRMLIRRALRFANSMGIERPFLTDLADAVICKMSPAYPELLQYRTAIRYQISAEEERFTKSLSNSLAELDARIRDMEASGKTVMSGREAFFLFATHGLPLELTRDLLNERGYSVDESSFYAELDKHREISGGEIGAFEDVTTYSTLLEKLRQEGVIENQGISYNPYDTSKLPFKSRIASIIRDGQIELSASYGDEVEIVLNQTAFYVESGGQISDTGTLSGAGWEIEVYNMREPVGSLIVHIGQVTNGEVHVADPVVGHIDLARRWDIMRNHTATHLLHASLRSGLGDHVRQKGSLVAPDRLRFDFTHNSPLSGEELDQIAALVNNMILANIPLEIVHKPLSEARKEGAMALFGEKYGDEVRTVTIGDPAKEARFSYELCGGTHVRSTGEIGYFLITHEESSGAGVRRIEAVTGWGAFDLITRRLNQMSLLSDRLNTQPENIVDAVDRLIESLNETTRRVETLARQSARQSLDHLLETATDLDGVKVVAAQVDAADADLLAEMADWCRDRLTSGIVVLGAPIDGKARLVAKVTSDLVEKGIHAGRIVNDVAQKVGGGGGGRPDFATAGGREPEKLVSALSGVTGIIQSMLTE